MAYWYDPEYEVRVEGDEEGAEVGEADGPEGNEDAFGEVEVEVGEGGKVV